MLEEFYVIVAVAAFILDDKKRLLIVKKSPREKIDGGLWTVPGGKGSSEEPIVKALKREVKEEVNLIVKNYRWIGEDVFISDHKYFHAEHFLCQVKNPNTIQLEKNLLDYRWITNKDINKFQFPFNIKKEIKNILSK